MSAPSVTFAPLSIAPQTTVYELLLTATVPLSHHDAAVQEDSNRTLFNRQRHLLAAPSLVALPGQAEIDRLCAAHPVPADIADLFADLSFPEFVAVALARLFLDLYNRANSGEGAGLFSGLERYTRLETRLRMAAVEAPTLRAWWNRLTHHLQTPIHPGEEDMALLSLLAVPPGLQQLVLRALSRDYRSIVALARLWHTTAKLQHAEYAERAGQAQASQQSVVLSFDATALVPGSNVAQVIEVPVVSGNSLRHQVVREPAWLHLVQQLGVQQHSLPAGAEAVFYNGGNIAAGAKQPSNTFALAQRIRQAYPSLDLVGGVTDSFDLGESRLQVAGWLVCRENAAALRGSPAADLPAASVSAFDLLDDVTLTRQGGMSGVGQMIWSFETLCAGTQVLCRLVLTPGTAPLTHGALVAAVETYLANAPTLGGQSARGFGQVVGEWLRTTGGDTALLRQAYEAYLAEHRERLLDGLADGTLCTGQRVLS